ncbi:hypothetical protein GGH96_005730 [Coemansia sp. RSA 1972]|nr:hypothetical protein GGH96_005730 [Coemansia sp. RSA 1972]
MDTSPERPIEASYPPSSASFTESSDTSPGEPNIDRLTIGLRRSSRRRLPILATPSPVRVTRSQTPVPRRDLRSQTPAPHRELRSRARASSSQTPKRRRTSRSSSSTQSASESAISSSLDCEVTIYTKGTSVPQSQARCCICSRVLHGDVEEINAHIDQCLTGQSEPMVEYEWAGQTRVRTTALVEGGLVAAGVADAASSYSSMRPSDEDVDVDTRDETHYGVPQFGDGDLVVVKECDRSHERTASDPQFEFVVADPQDDPEPEDSVSEPQPEDSTQQPLMPKHEPSHAASQLVIEALKARIRDQDRELQRAPKCSVCQGAFNEPCVSINCWHVFCTSCWMHSLGTKKLCPQCQQITQPYDLRCIYM